MTQSQMLGISAGVVIAVMLPFPGWLLVFSMAAPAIGWVAYRCVRSAAFRQPQAGIFATNRFPGTLFHVALCASAGSALAGVQLLCHEKASVHARHDARISGCIVTTPVGQHDSVRFVFESSGRTLSGRSIRYRVSWYRPEMPPEAGSCWRLTVRLKPVRGNRNEAGFDYERWLFAQRIHGLGSVRATVPAVKLPWKGANAAYLMARTRLYSRLAGLTEGHPGGALAGALAVGRRDDLTAGDWERLKRTGTAHLMAISGLHVGLAALFGFALGRYLPIPVGPTSDLSRRGAVTALLVATLYSGVAGFAVSTVRALMMLALWHLCRQTRRRVDVTTTLLLTVAMILVVWPWMVADIGFWLSVSAVAAIAVAAFGRPPAITLADRLYLALRIQLGITLLMLPVAIHVAEGISWVSVPVNLVLIPVFSVCVVPLVLLMLVTLVAMPAAADLVVAVLIGVLDRIWHVLDWLSMQTWAFSPLGGLSIWLTVPALVCGVLLLLPSGFPGRLSGWVLLLSPFFVRADQPDFGEFQLDVLDVGQALSVLVQTRNRMVVYDTGNAWPGGDSAESVVLPVLRNRHVSQLDVLIVSHADRDHAGGAVRLQQALLPPAAWVGEPVPGLHNAKACERGTRWTQDGVRFMFLHPAPESTYSGNEQSCVLLIEGVRGSALLTGDLGRALERRLIPDLDGRAIDVVVGAHHGSLSSSDARFIAATQARFVVFSNGHDNQWGMPRDQVVSRWQAAGTRVLTTAASGQLTFGTGGRGRLDLQKRWRDEGFGAWRRRSGAP